MIECLQCNELELVGAIFCRQCGTQMIPKTAESISIPKMRKAKLDEQQSFNDIDIKNSQSRSTPEPIYPPSSKENTSPSATPQPIVADDEAEVTERIVLQVLKTGQLIPIKEEDEITLGRVSAGQPIVPDIDLTPYQGLEAGVSRLHASIRIKANEIYIMDLGSANGTQVDGEKLTPSSLHKLENQSTITLGKLNLKVLIKS